MTARDITAFLVSIVGIVLFAYVTNYFKSLVLGIISLGACFIASYIIMLSGDKEDRLKKMEARIKELEEAQKQKKENH